MNSTSVNKPSINTPSKFARNIYIAALTPIYIGGLAYTLTPKFLPYHAIAVGKSWEQIDSLMQVLIISALNAGGGLILCNAVAMTILLTIPFKRGEIWASWAITSIGTATMLTVIRSAIHVDINTPANPPWLVLLIIIVLLILALIASIKHDNKN